MQTLSQKTPKFKTFLAIHKATGRIFNVNRVYGGIIQGKKFVQFVCSIPGDESSYLFNLNHVSIKTVN